MYMDQFKGQFSVLLIRDTQMRENKKKCVCPTQIREKAKNTKKCVRATHK